MSVSLGRSGSDRARTAGNSLVEWSVRRIFLFAVTLAAALLASSPAQALEKTVNGISVDVNLPHARRGVGYDFQIMPSGRPGPYTFEILSGTLPLSFSMSRSGEVSGKSCVAANGTYKFDLRITSADGTVADFQGTTQFSINMTAGPPCSLEIGPGSLAPAVAGTPYDEMLSASGGAGSYTFSLGGGSLPGGLSLSSMGTISGTPTETGTFTFEVVVTDGEGNSGKSSYTITVNAAPPVPSTPPAGGSTSTGGTTSIGGGTTSAGGATSTGGGITTGGTGGSGSGSGSTSTGGTTSNPGSGTTGTGGGTTSNPGGTGGGTTTNPGGTTTSTGGGTTTNPSGGTTTNPGTGTTTTNPDGTTGGGTTTDLSGGTTTSTGGGTMSNPGSTTTGNPGTGTTGNPGGTTTGGTTTDPSGSTTANPGGTTANPGTTSTGGGGTSNPGTGTTTSEPGGSITTTPGGTTTNPGVTTTTTNPGGTPTTTNPGGTTTNPAGTTTGDPGGTTTTNPGGTTTTNPGSTSGPGVTSRSVKAGDGEITIDLSKGEKTGGIDLTTLVKMSQPAAAPVQFEIVQQPVDGRVTVAGPMLTYTPSATAERDAIRYVAIQEGVRSAPATVWIRVLRASLTGDPKLTDLTRAQLDTAAVTGLRQLDNIMTHIEGGGWDDRCLVRNRVTLRSARPYTEDQSRVAEPSERVNSPECKRATVVSAWAAGTVTVDDKAGRASTDGLTAGIEAQPSRATIVGFAAGLSRSRYGQDAIGSLRLSSVSGSGYGAWRLARAVQLTGAVGYADLDIRTRRQLNQAADLGVGHRSGHALFATIGGSADFTLGKAVVSSYARASLVDIRLRGNSEDGQQALAIDNGAVNQRQSEGTFGATVRYPVPLPDGTLTPFARLEGRWHSAGSFVQDVAYRDAPAEAEIISSDQKSSGGWSIGAGARYETRRFRLMAEYRLTHEESWSNNSVRIEASVNF